MSLAYQRFKKGYLVDGSGNYIVDGSGNYIVVRDRGEAVYLADKKYRVYLQRRISKDQYDANLIEITDYVIKDGITEIGLRIENEDYDIGVFSYGEITIDLNNFNGWFSGEKEPRSIFAWRRDKARIIVKLNDQNGVYVEQFVGLVQDDHTTEDADEQTVSLSVLSRDSLFRRVFIKGGAIPSGATVSQALRIVLNRPDVTNFINYDVANINPPLNVVIDDASSFDNKAASEILDDLMLICGGILYVDADNNVIVSDRSHTAEKLIYSIVEADGSALVDGENYIVAALSPEETAEIYPWRFYGPGDLLGRANVLALDNITSGLNRCFTQFRIGETVAFDSVLLEKFGFKEKDLGIDDVITNADTQQQIVDYYLSQFSVPRRECEITVRSDEAMNINLLDTLLLNYPPLIIARKGRPKKKGLLVDSEGNFIVDGEGAHIEVITSGEVTGLPFFRRAKYGTAHYAKQLTTTIIDGRVAWKVIAKTQDTVEMTTVIKMREIGTTEGEEIWS